MPAGGECEAALTELRAWLDTIDVGPVTDAPVDDAEPRILLYPLALLPTPAIARPERGSTTAQVELHVLLTAVGGDPQERACLATDLALHVLTSGRWTPRSEQPASETWAALGLPPRPALTLEVRVRRTLAAAPAPPVLEPLRLDSVPIRALNGRVVAANGVPLAAAVVSLEPTGPTVTSDHRGRFTVTSGTPSPVRVTVLARGLRRSLTLPVADDGGLGDLVLEGLAATPSTPQEV